MSYIMENEEMDYSTKRYYMMKFLEEENIPVLCNDTLYSMYGRYVGVCVLKEIYDIIIRFEISLCLLDHDNSSSKEELQYARDMVNMVLFKLEILYVLMALFIISEGEKLINKNE